MSIGSRSYCRICCSLALLALGCETRGDGSASTKETPTSAVNSAVAASKRIGDPCKPTDGWQRMEPPEATAMLQSGKRAKSSVPYDSQNAANLPAGTPYCAPADSGHPGGYFTVACDKDLDCPNAAICAERFCTKPCSSAADCISSEQCESLPGRPTARVCTSTAPTQPPQSGGR